MMVIKMTRRVPGRKRVEKVFFFAGMLAGEEGCIFLLASAEIEESSLEGGVPKGESFCMGASTLFSEESFFARGPSRSSRIVCTTTCSVLMIGFFPISAPKRDAVSSRSVIIGYHLFFCCCAQKMKSMRNDLMLFIISRCIGRC